MVSEDIKKLVITRLQSMPPNLKLSVGRYGTFTKEELIERVQKEDEVGKLIIEMQLKYLRSFKKGII
mgnify:CR=1 FL=1